MNRQGGTMLLAGLDIGTTGCKVTVYTPQGGLLGRVYRDYPVTRSAAEHEVEAGAIWQAVQGVLAEAACQYPGISGIGVTSFGEALVLLDGNDKPLRHTMLYTDPRGEAECRHLTASLGRDRLAGITGLNAHPMYSLPKLMWVKKHQPAIFAATKRVLLMGDYIVYMLTGTAQIDYALASRTMAFDILALDWSDEILSAAGVGKSLFSRPVAVGERAGAVKAGLAQRLGLRGDTTVCSCGHDQVAAAVGSGVFEPSIAVDGAGTVECITPVFMELPDLAKMSRGSYAVVPYAEPGAYVCYAFSYTGGALIKWFVDTLAGYAYSQAKKENTSIYKRLEGDSPMDGPTGLLVLPHFAGAATPYMDSGSRGAILGLTVTSTESEIFCGLMEGVCYEMRLNMEWLRDGGVDIKRLYATGGGANSRVWMQMKADVLNVPLTSLASSEAGATGSAMMVGVAKGIHADLRAAARLFVKEKETFYPRPRVHHAYSRVYENYKKLYSAIRPLM